MRKFGHYIIEGELGTGGFGVVLKARDERLDRFAAIKLLRAEIAGDRALVELLRREAKAAARLSHPNIVTVYDMGEQDGQAYIAMEYVAGRSLAAIIDEKDPLPVERKVDLAIQVASALQYAHERGVIHRDVKPLNILVRADGAAKLADFGLARTVSSAATHSLALVGTVNYMSPERIEDRAADQRADVFSLGAVFYELLAYRRAYPGKEITAVVYRIVHGAPEPLVEVRGTEWAWLEPWVMRCLERDPARRLSSCGELAEGLRQGLRERAERMAAGAAVQTLIVPGPPVAGDDATRTLLIPPAASPPPAGVPAPDPAASSRTQPIALPWWLRRRHRPALLGAGALAAVAAVGWIVARSGTATDPAVVMVAPTPGPSPTIGEERATASASASETATPSPAAAAMVEATRRPAATPRRTPGAATPAAAPPAAVRTPPPAPTAAARPDVVVNARHHHAFGGCNGTLRFTVESVVFDSGSEDAHDRTWRYRDLRSFRYGQSASGAGGSRRKLTIKSDRDYDFQLEEPLPHQLVERVDALVRER